MSCLVDFVLESGTEELAESVEISQDMPPCSSPRSHSISTSAVKTSVMEAPDSFIRQGREAPTQKGQVSKGNRRLPFVSSRLSESKSRPRTWPLADPEEARLLSHFVDKVSSFV